MSHTRIALLALVVLSSVAGAQRGGGGAGGGASGRGMGGNEDRFGKSKEIAAGGASGVKLSVGDVEDMNPVRLLVNKRKDINLSDEQLKQVKDIDGRLKELNKLQFNALDSLRTATRPRPGTDAEVERIRVAVARDAFGAMVQSIRGNYDTALKEALSRLDATQASKAGVLLKKQSEDTNETLRDKMGGGGGGRRGG